MAGGVKKTPRGTVWVVPAEAKRPCNYPLSTDNCYCQASEEERLNLLLTAARELELSVPRACMESIPADLRETYVCGELPSPFFGL